MTDDFRTSDHTKPLWGLPEPDPETTALRKRVGELMAQTMLQIIERQSLLHSTLIQQRHGEMFPHPMIWFGEPFDD